jgi:hypothetical protein
VLTLAIVGAAVIVGAFVVGYGMWTARRLDRLHARVDAAAAALDEVLRRRCDVVGVFASSDGVPPVASDALRRAAAAAVATPGLGHDREYAENTLSRALQSATGIAAGAFATAAGVQVLDVATRAGFARRFHNDAVRDALVVRRRRIVRLLRLAGSARLPAYFEMDDGVDDHRRTIDT